jgi:Leucine-rich repeat (LRR) protein
MNVSGLVHLTQLSLENNEITRLDGLDDLQCLMELYLGNNLVADVKEIIKLQELQRLIILDISGNPISSGVGNNLNYRIYSIYHLRKLRVLDGVSIDPQEHLEAKETFSGRLTDELLSTKLSGRKLSDVRDLDLSNCKLRDFEDMFDNTKVPNLKELNLNGNLMSSMRCFGFLPGLKVLRLK